MFTRRIAFALLLSMSIQVIYLSAEGQGLPSKEQMQTMLPVINEKLKANPNDLENLMMRSFVHESMENHNAAVADLDRVIAVADPANKKVALVRRCCLYGRRKDFKHALSDANAVIALSPDAVGYANRGVIYLNMNQMANATKDLSIAARLDSRLPSAWEGLGEVAYKARQYQKAVDYFDAALNLNSKMLDALYYRGKSRQALGKQEQGRKDVERALALGYKEDQVQTIYKNSR